MRERAEDCHRLCAALREFLGRWSEEVEESIRREIAGLLQSLQAEEVTITFGGHFSAGKSTLINALLGRELLPTSAMAETGALCLIRRGQADRGELRWQDGRRQGVPLETDALRHAISLYDLLGSPNEQVSRIDRLEITLADFPPDIAPAALEAWTIRWIDSPGINERAEMEARAQYAALQTDLLVWIFTTRQFLSLTEQAFLAEYIAQRGEEALVLLVNAFLEEDTPQAWERFRRERLQTQWNSLEAMATEMGLAAGVSGRAMTVAARAMLAAPGSYGGPELRRLLTSCARHDAERVVRARMRRAAILLRALADEQAGEAHAAQRGQERAEQAWRQLETGQAACREALAGAMASYAETWQQQARQQASLAGRIDRAGLSAATERTLAMLFDHLDGLLKRYLLAPLPAELRYTAAQLCHLTGIGGETQLSSALLQRVARQAIVIHPLLRGRLEAALYPLRQEQLRAWLIHAHGNGQPLPLLACTGAYAMPEPERAPETALVAFCLECPEAASVSVAGSFNDWDKRAMPLTRLEGEPVWVAMAAVQKREILYKFVIDGVQWRLDPHAPTATDTYGMPVSRLESPLKIEAPPAPPARRLSELAEALANLARHAATTETADSGGAA